MDFTVVGSGPNGANPHHEAGDRTIERGDMVVLDFGGLKHGYGSDTSRTVHVGEPTAEEQRVHDIVREAQEAAAAPSGPASPARRSTGRPAPSSPNSVTASASSTAPATASASPPMNPRT